MTREDIINQVLRNTSIEESEDYMEDYPYSRPSGQMSGWNVPLASTVGGVAAQSFGGHGVGGGFPFIPLPSLGGMNPETQEEYAYQTETEPEYATVSEAEFERARAAEGALAPEGVLVPERVFNPEGVPAPEGALAPEGIKSGYRKLTVDYEPQTQTNFEQLKLRGAEAVEQMRKQGEILRGERLSAEQMASAPEAKQMQFGRFSDTARAEQAVRRANPNANAQQIKAKAEEIAEKSRSSAEPIMQEDLQITYKDYRTPQLERIKEASSGTFGRNKTQVAVSGRDFSDVKSIKNYERNIQGVSSVSPNKPIVENVFQPEVRNKGIISKAIDWLARPQAATEITSTIFGLGAIGGATSALPAFGSSEALGAAFGLGGDTISSAMAEQAKPLDTRAIQRTNYNFTPVRWNPSTQRVDAVSSAAPKVTTTPTIKTAAEKVASALKNISTPKTTTTQKLTTKEKRLNKL